MEKAKLENFEDFYKYLRTTNRRFEMASEGSAPDDYQMNIAKDAWNYQQTKLDTARAIAYSREKDKEFLRKEIKSLKAINKELENAIEIIRRENGKRDL